MGNWPQKHLLGKTHLKFQSWSRGWKSQGTGTTGWLELSRNVKDRERQLHRKEKRTGLGKKIGPPKKFRSFKTSAMPRSNGLKGTRGTRREVTKSLDDTVFS